VDDQIYLVPGEPYQPDGPVEPAAPSVRRRALWLAALLAVAVVAVGVQHSRISHLPVAAVAAAPQPVPVAEQYQPWPEGAAVCGNRVGLAQISSELRTDPRQAPTGVTVPVTGALPALVNVDTGRRSPIPGLRLRADQYASKIVRAGPVSYVLVRSCQRSWSATVIRAQAGRPQQVVAGDHTVYGLIGDESGAVWAEAYTGPTKVSPAAAIGTTLVRLDRPGPPVMLPPELNVIGVSGSQVAATTAGPPQAVTLSSLYRYDMSSRRTSLLGTAYSATESRGTVIWTSTPCSAWGACTLRSYDLRTGRSGTQSYHLPLGSGVSGGVLSPDGHKLAFILQREIGDLYYRSDSSKNPADLVVLDLTTGLVEPVPGLELAPGVDPTSITFSPDSGWLIATLPSDGAIDVYSWRSPLSKPLFTPRPDLWAWPGIRDQQVNPQ